VYVKCLHLKRIIPIISLWISMGDKLSWIVRTQDVSNSQSAAKLRERVRDASSIQPWVLAASLTAWLTLTTPI
jgi:hypothetical protein